MAIHCKDMVYKIFITTLVALVIGGAFFYAYRNGLFSFMRSKESQGVTTSTTPSQDLLGSTEGKPKFKLIQPNSFLVGPIKGRYQSKTGEAMVLFSNGRASYKANEEALFVDAAWEIISNKEIFLRLSEDNVDNIYFTFDEGEKTMRGNGVTFDKKE